MPCLLSLDSETYPNLDALLKLFRCSKGDVRRVLVKRLSKGKTAPLHDGVAENLHKVKDVENESDHSLSVSCDYDQTVVIINYRDN